jgi:hypothetical protein
VLALNKNIAIQRVVSRMRIWAFSLKGYACFAADNGPCGKVVKIIEDTVVSHAKL